MRLGGVGQPVSRKEGSRVSIPEGAPSSRRMCDFGSFGCDGRTKIVNTSLFYTTEERDGMLNSGMTDGMNESYAALDRLLATLD